MPLASGANVGLSYVAEVTRGTTPGSPTMKAARFTGRNLNLTRATLTSNERRNDRQIADLRHGFNQVGGSLGFELSTDAFNDFLEAAMAGTWAVAPTTGAQTLASTTSTFTRATGSFITDGFMPGDMVTVTGFVTGGNNGVTQVVSVSALVLTVAKTLVADVAAAARTIAGVGKKLKVGSTLKTFTFERRFTDITQYQVFAGVAINQMSFNIKPDQIIGGSFDVIGMSSQPLSGTSLGSPTAAPTGSPFDAFTANLYINGVANAVVTDISFQLANNRSVNPVVGSKFSPDVFEGTCQVTGTLMAYLQDAAVLNLFTNETECSLFAKFPDPNGTDYFVVQLPRIKLTSADSDPPQQGPITVSYKFQALVEPNSGTSIAFQRSTVT
ncbi:phage tail tube protein [Candidatus Contendibacter odensensis]|uniref:Uncharacterized protein n=1 Tax=Candidatus Contendobacter odensis Run_B_J11 TaxID=1400861 RepID=A0A7U7G9A3_9GAMM|nr:phage tail tube protein [Candidatus Contendobacter odensis]CDH43850.1 hypothetical protein BN874_1370015 [Candidatus Contendobacter odensis Run_B_J11]